MNLNDKRNNKLVKLHKITQWFFNYCRDVAQKFVIIFNIHQSKCIFLIIKHISVVQRRNFILPFKHRLCINEALRQPGVISDFHQFKGLFTWCRSSRFCSIMALYYREFLLSKNNCTATNYKKHLKLSRIMSKNHLGELSLVRIFSNL